MEPSRDKNPQKLNDDDIETRLSSLKSFSGLQDDRSIGAVVDAMGDPEWRVRKNAVEIILGVEDRSKIVSALIDRLGRRKNIGMRNAAVEVFVRLGKVCVGPLLAYLTGAEEEIKKLVIDILGDIKDPRAEPGLIACLSDPDENIQASASEALGKIQGPEAISALLPLLRKESPLVVFSTIKALERIGDSRAAPDLIEISAKNIFKRAGLEALGAIGEIRALNTLVSALQTGSKSVRTSALKAIVSLEGKLAKTQRHEVKRRVREVYGDEIYSYLIDTLNESDKSLKASAVKLIGWASDTKCIPALVSLLEGDIREEASSALVLMGIGAVDPLLLEFPKKDEKGREAIALILGEIGDRRASASLLALLKDPCGHVRQAAATGLERIKDPEAVPALLHLLKDDYPNVQEAAMRALIQMKESTPTAPLVEFLHDSQPSLRSNAALLLGELRREAAVSPLSFLLKDPEDRVRWAAVEALGFFDSAEINQYLFLALGDESSKVRLGALNILGRRRVDDLASRLTPLVHDKDIWVRSALARALGALEGETVKKLLLDLLMDPVGAVKIATLTALGERKDPTVLPFVLEQTSNLDIEVKKGAILALGALKSASAAPLLMTFLSDGQWAIRGASARALGELGDRAALPKLQALAASDEDSLVREAARSAVSRIVQPSGNSSDADGENGTDK